MFVIYFNKSVVRDYELANMYEITLNGDFTIDKVAEIIKGLYTDLNGNGKSDAKDIFGFAIGTGNPVDVLYNAFDQPIIKKDKDNGSDHGEFVFAEPPPHKLPLSGNRDFFLGFALDFFL